jgi:hypothetical protein
MVERFPFGLLDFDPEEFPLLIPLQAYRAGRGDEFAATDRTTRLLAKLKSTGQFSRSKVNPLEVRFGEPSLSCPANHALSRSAVER